MYKADTNRVFQEANQAIVEIRKSEIEFYLRVAAGLGTQAALIGGFTYLTFSQNLEADYVYTYYVNAIYYVTAAFTLAFAIHVILTTMLIQILGPGLALNGPVGSMARAVEGMRVEQRQILGSFFMMMFFFASSTFLLFWVTMEKWSALISSFGFLVCARYWLYYCGRIYRRFYWDSKGTPGQWRRESLDSEDEPTVPVSILNMAATANAANTATNATQNPVHDLEQGTANGVGGVSSNLNSNQVSVDEKPTFMERMSFVGGTGRMSLVDRVSFAIMPGAVKKTDPNIEKELATRPSLLYTQSERPSFQTRPSMSGFVIPPGAVTVNPKDIACQGFIVMNTAPKGLIKQKNKWDRRFVVLNFRGQLFYYQSRAEFKDNPHNHINPRPLSLDDFYITTERFPDVETTTLSTTTSNSPATGNNERFWFTLIPKDDDRYRNWQYRTDTEEELDMWLTAMSQVSPSSFKQFLDK